MSDNIKLLNIKEVSEKLGVSKNTVYDWCAYGRIPHIKVGKFLRFNIEDINNWLTENKVKVKE